MNTIILRRATNNNDSTKLKSLLNTIFNPEKVGDLAEVLFHSYPGMDKSYWFIAEDTVISEMVATFTLIPWVWEIEGIPLKVAEMGLVGTLEKYRGMGLMRQLNCEFDKSLTENKFDLAVIQGIPGFYQNFGYQYSVTLENHFVVTFDLLNKVRPVSGFNFRLADVNDIPFLMEQDIKYRNRYSLSVMRDFSCWKYLLNESKLTEYGSDFWILENNGAKPLFYFRIPYYGFGTGLIVNEISEDIDTISLDAVLLFCKDRAVERNKPFIRFNLHNNSFTAKYIRQLGVEESLPYAWQVKFPDKIRILNKIKPVLERRLSDSLMRSFSGTLRFDLYRESIDLVWEKGKLISVEKSSGEECDHTFCINSDIFPALILGYRSWKELQFIRPDTSPATLYINEFETRDTDKSGLLADILFPKTDSWIYLQY